VDTTKISDEVNSIYKNLLNITDGDEVKLYTKPKPQHYETIKVLKRYVLIPFILIIISSIIVLSFSLAIEYLKIATLLLLLVSYVGIGAAQMLELYAGRKEIGKLLCNPNYLILNDLHSKSQNDIDLITFFKQYSTESLLLVQNNLKLQHTSIEKRIGILVGAVEKIGVIPGVLTLYLAAVSEGVQIVQLSIVGVVFVMYVFAYSFHYSLPKLCYFANIIQLELDARK